MGGLSITHWAIVLLIVVLLFGARRLPDTARGLARSLRIFKSEMADEDQTQPRQRSSTTQHGDLSGWPKIENPPPAATLHDTVEQSQAASPEELKKTG